MKKTKFVSGVRVADTFNKSEAMNLLACGDGVRRGVVVEKGKDYDGRVVRPADGYVVVIWDNYSYAQAVSVNHLMLETEADDKLLPFEEEFNKLTADIEEKMKQAGDSLREAHKVAQKLGLDDLSYLESVQPLMQAMDEIGWRTSSLNC